MAVLFIALSFAGSAYLKALRTRLQKKEIGQQ
jgi:hypothetical protein